MSERRTDADIRADIAAERERLVQALDDLRADVAAKRKPAAAVGALVVAGVGFTALRRLVRRLRR